MFLVLYLVFIRNASKFIILSIVFRSSLMASLSFRFWSCYRVLIASSGRKSSPYSSVWSLFEGLICWIWSEPGGFLIATILFDDGEAPKLLWTMQLSSNLGEDEEVEIPNPPQKAFKLSVLSLSMEGCVFIKVCLAQPLWAP